MPSWCPSGHAIKLQPGLAGFITQALGGSFTLYIEGNLYRLAGSEADAIGKEAVTPPELPPNATEDDVTRTGLEADAHLLRPGDPGQHRRPRPHLRMRRHVRMTTAPAHVDVKMTLTAPGCGMGEVLVQDVKEKIEVIPDRARRQTSNSCSIHRGAGR